MRGLDGPLFAQPPDRRGEQPWQLARDHVDFVADSAAGAKSARCGFLWAAAGDHVVGMKKPPEWRPECAPARNRPANFQRPIAEAPRVKRTDFALQMNDLARSEL
jgi:hypothetical protein